MSLVIHDVDDVVAARVNVVDDYNVDVVVDDDETPALMRMSLSQTPALHALSLRAKVALTGTALDLRSLISDLYLNPHPYTSYPWVYTFVDLCTS